MAFVGDIVGRPSRNSYDGVCVCTLHLASHSAPWQIGEVSVVTFATVHASDPTAFILAAVLDLNEAFQLLFAKSADVVISLQVRGVFATCGCSPLVFACRHPWLLKQDMHGTHTVDKDWMSLGFFVTYGATCKVYTRAACPSPLPPLPYRTTRGVS